MLSNSLDVLLVADRRGHELRTQAAAERLRAPRRRRALAASLRRAADRLDPVPIAGRPAGHAGA